MIWGLSISLDGFSCYSLNVLELLQQPLSISLDGFSTEFVASQRPVRLSLSISLDGFEEVEPHKASDIPPFQFHWMDSTPSRSMFTVEISLISIVWILFH